MSSKVQLVACEDDDCGSAIVLRAAIYARYSSIGNTPESARDQIKRIRERLQRGLIASRKFPKAQIVIDEDWVDEADPVVPVAHGPWVDHVRGHADSHGKHEGAVSHPLAEGLGGAPLPVHMVRVEVARLASVQHYIRLCDRPPGSPARGTDHIVFEELLDNRAHVHLRGQCGVPNRR